MSDEEIPGWVRAKAAAGSKRAQYIIKARVMKNMQLNLRPEHCHHCAEFTAPCTCGAVQK